MNIYYIIEYGRMRLRGRLRRAAINSATGCAGGTMPLFQRILVSGLALHRTTGSLLGWQIQSVLLGCA